MGTDKNPLARAPDIATLGRCGLADTAGVRIVRLGPTVVTILLGVIAPTSLVLGAKDAQQVAVLRRVIRDLALDVQLVVAPTWREPDGLAMSSRNIYLSEQQRAAAPSSVAP
jgi:pantothenate synthetase